MTRISDMKEEFYAKLHAMENPTTQYEIDGSIKRTSQTMLGHIPENDPRIKELRKLLGISIEDKPKVNTRKIENTYNTNLIRLYIEQSGRTYTSVSIGAGITYATFLKKLKSGKFREHEIAGVAAAIGLREEVIDGWLV